MSLAKAGILLIICGKLYAIQIIWDNSLKEGNLIEYYGDGKRGAARIANWLLIFPGTKWCGAGNVADNNDDLGEFSDTDKCCRTHDFCDDIIEGYETKYNLTNPAFYTRLNCKCDKQFYKCLKDANSKPSNQVGHLYFTFLGTQCFRNDYPIDKCVKYGYIPRKKCIEYRHDTSKQKLYQWFDLPNF